jgi:hypothetical protein
MSNFRDRDLLNLAYALPCQLQIPGVCTGGDPSEPAHSNQSRHGKGKSLKAHDCFFAASCRECHVEIDQGSRLTREERIDIWQRGFERTVLVLWQRGLLLPGDFADILRSKPEETRVVPILESGTGVPKTGRRGSKRGTWTKTPRKCFKGFA